MSYQIISHRAEETLAIGRSFGPYCEEGLIFLLDGNLAAGKTVFAKGLGAGLGVTSSIKSPSYALMCQYDGTLPFYHFDAYNLNGLDDFYDLGFDEFLEEGVALIEWASVISEEFPYDYIHVSIAPGENEEERRLTLTAHGSGPEVVLEEWRSHENFGL